MRRVLLASKVIGVSAALAALSYGIGFAVFQAQISYLLHFCVILVITVGQRVVSGLRPARRSDLMVREEIAAPDLLVPDRPFSQARRWEERLELIRGDAIYFHQTVVPALGELIDERLRLTHGISRASEPDRARQILGERLWSYLESEPRRQAPSHSELLDVIQEMETLWSKHH